MTRDQTRQIREHALEDTDLTTTARLLLSLIIDWHHKEKGCVMHDSTMAEKLGLSDRTVMRRRQELIEAGYLRQVHGAHRRELVPKVPCSSVISGDTDGNRGDTRDERDDTDVTPGGDTAVTHMRNNNPEGASSRGHAGEEGRWDFLPGYRARFLPEIQSEAGSEDHPPDVLSIASRYLEQPQDDLASTVDYHLNQMPEDQVIAAYVIAGRVADQPLQYADAIIRQGWKESRSGGDGASSRLPTGDETVVHFGSNA